MATEMITLKLDDKFLDEIDSFVKKEGYKNRTEFIRMALRLKVDECKLREAMASIAHVRGAAKRKISDEEYEENRQKAFEELSKRFK
ncbi:MAG: ribbon-helix-helix domain-containing protein [Candidatus Woesearchaeota archaeon]